jgi:hypothetical protein
MHEANSPALAMWARLGFTQTVCVQEGRTEVARALEYLKPIYDGLVQRGKIPKNARTVSLRQADPRQIARLHVDCLGGIYEEILAVLHGDTPLQYDPQLSPVVLIDGNVMAFNLCERTGPDSMFCHATVVHPSLRNGWANVWLKYHGTRLCAELGLKTYWHHSYDHHRDTRRYNRATGATTRMLLEPYRVLVEPDGDSLMREAGAGASSGG